jgi:hypothetical protein
MSKVKNQRLGLIGLCVMAACALMAFAASGAQAEAGSAWMVGKTTLTSGTLLVEGVINPEPYTFENGESTETANVALLLGNTALGPIWIGCKKAVGADITLIANGGGTGKVSFSECSTSIKQEGHMKLSTACKPVEPIEAGGKALIILHLGTPYAHLEGTEGAEGKFTTIVIPKGCALEGSYVVKGLVLVEDCEGAASFATEKLVHLIKEAMAPTLELSTGLFFGKFGTQIDGSGNLEIFDGGVMKEFSGLPA